MNFDLFKKTIPKFLKKNPHTLGDAILANANNCKVAPVTPVDNTVCSPDSRIFGSVLFFPFPVLCTKMILTQQESAIAYDLLQGNLGRRVKGRLENALEGASTSETITAQALYCREVLYVLDKCSRTYSKKT